MKRKIIIPVLLVTILNFQVLSDESQKKLPVGFIFNISNILDAPESYQGGIGLKFLTENANLRVLSDYYYSQSASTSSISLGLAYEKHITENYISPYYGFSAQVSYTSIKEEFDDDNWTHHTIIPIEAGPILGVEVFFTEYLSFFAEYIVNLQYIMNNYKQSIAGTESSETNSSFMIDTKMGNNAKLGLTIYLDDQVTMPKRD